MKKVLLAAATVAMLFATSCKKDVNAPENIQLGENEFLATIDNGAVPQNAPAVRNGMSTMTTIDDSRRVFWQAGDEITINGVAYKAKTTDNPVVFEPYNPGIVAPESAKYHAFYSVNHEQDGSVSLPNHQSYYDDTDVRNLPMYAYSTTKELTFHNICAVIKIVVPSFAANTDKIIISSDQQMNGSFSVDGNFKAVMIAPEEGLGDDDKMITMETAMYGQTFSEDDAVYIAVPAQEYTNFKVEFFNGDHSVWCKTLASCELAVNTVYPITMSEMPKELCFTAAEDNVTIRFDNIPEELDYDDEGNKITIQYSRDAEEWNDYEIVDEMSGQGEGISLNKGEKVYFRASANHSMVFEREPGADARSHFEINGPVYASGDIMSLYGPDCPHDNIPEYAFMFLFQGCVGLITAPELTATTLSTNCYYGMFGGCTHLKEVYIYATSVAIGAYSYFYDLLSDAGTEADEPTIHCKPAIKSAIEANVDTDIWTVTDDLP